MLERSVELDGETELGERRGGARLEIAAAAREEGVERVVVVAGQLRLRGEPRGELVHPLRRGRDTGAAGQVREQRLVRKRIPLLGQVADGERRRVAPHRPPVGLLLPGEQAQQRRLAGAVRADEPDPRARRHDEVHAVEDDVCSVRLRDGGRGECADRAHVDLRDENEPLTVERRERGWISRQSVIDGACAPPASVLGRRQGRARGTPRAAPLRAGASWKPRTSGAPSGGGRPARAAKKPATTGASSSTPNPSGAGPPSSCEARQPEGDVERGIADPGVVPVDEDRAAVAETEVVAAHVAVHQGSSRSSGARSSAATSSGSARSSHDGDDEAEAEQPLRIALDDTPGGPVLCGESRQHPCRRRGGDLGKRREHSVDVSVTPRRRPVRVCEVPRAGAAAPRRPPIRGAAA